MTQIEIHAHNALFALFHNGEMHYNQWRGKTKTPNGTFCPNDTFSKVRDLLLEDNLVSEKKDGQRNLYKINATNFGIQEELSKPFEIYSNEILILLKLVKDFETKLKHHKPMLKQNPKDRKLASKLLTQKPMNRLTNIILDLLEKQKLLKLFLLSQMIPKTYQTRYNQIGKTFDQTIGRLFSAIFKMQPVLYGEWLKILMAKSDRDSILTRF